MPALKTGFPTSFRLKYGMASVLFGLNIGSEWDEKSPNLGTPSRFICRSCMSFIINILLRGAASHNMQIVNYVFLAAPGP